MLDLESQLRAYGSVLDGAEASVAEVFDAPPRRARRSFVVAIAAGVAVVLASAAIGIAASRSRNARRPIVNTGPPATTPAPVGSGGVIAIGDSVMLGAKTSIESALPGVVVDAILSRQLHQGATVLSSDLAQAVPVGTVVVDLGTNGPATASELDSIVRAAGRREVYFVTVRVPRTWEAPNNVLLRALPARWPNVKVIDWQSYADAHVDWFFADGFHLTPVGQKAYATFLAAALGRLAPATPPAPSGLDVAAVIAQPGLAPAPLAVADGDVWIASRSLTATPSVRLERRDPTTAKLLGTIDVPQEGLFSVAGDGDTLWVAGGGDGGVPLTTVSRIDARANRVVFTKTLAGQPCSCTIVAGSAGVWLVGNGSHFALHLSSSDGHVLADVTLPTASRAAIEVSSRLLVGLDDGSVAVVDPGTDRVVGTIARPVVGDAPTEAVGAMSPASIPAIGSDPAIDGFVVRANGSASALFGTEPNLNEILAVDFAPTTVVDVGNLMWVFGADRLEVASTHAVVSNEFAFDAGARRFDRVPASPATQVQGFRDAVTADNMVWVVYDAGDGTQPSVVVVKAPASFPFR